jgi:hypothetical protein
MRGNFHAAVFDGKLTQVVDVSKTVISRFIRTMGKEEGALDDEILVTDGMLSTKEGSYKGHVRSDV